MLANSGSFENNRERTDGERTPPAPGSRLCGEWGAQRVRVIMLGLSSSRRQTPVSVLNPRPAVSDFACRPREDEYSRKDVEEEVSDLPG